MFPRAVASWAAILGALSLQFGYAQGTAAGTARPNVVLVLADDLGATDLGCTGSTFYETPRLDQLAREGMRFTQAYAACPVCSPSRAALMTGRWPARVGITDYIGGTRRGKLLPADYLHELPHAEVTVAETLKQAGYATGMFGKWHLGGRGYLPGTQGFDVAVCGENGAGFRNVVDRGDLTTAPALEFIEAHRHEPFFVYLPHNLVHTPLESKPELVAKYERKRAALAPADGPRFRPERDRQDRRVQDHAVYAAMMEDLDTQVGRVLDKLAELGIAERTIVIFTSDNGGLSTSEGSPTSNAPLRAGKGWLYEGGVRVPAIVRWPGRVAAGSHCDTPVVTTDYFPTILEMCGLPPEPERHVDGRSLVPLLTGVGPLAERALYWHYPHYGNQGGVPGGAVRQGPWKLIEFFEDNRVELYHLGDDPTESTDQAAARPAEAAALRAALAAWRTEVKARMPQPNPNFTGQTEVLPRQQRPGAPGRRALGAGAKAGPFRE